VDDRALADWLALREGADADARSATLTRAVVDALGPGEPLRILDLGTGTGANIRYLLDRFPRRRQQWLAVDRSSALLALLPTRIAQWGAARGYRVAPGNGGCVIRGNGVECEVDTRQVDLGTLPGSDVFGPRHLVTASALLDLVSERWLRELAAWCRHTHAAVLFALTYNGQSSCEPAEPEDELVLALFNRHQHTDKGLGGPAAGPDAPAVAARCFEEAGFHVLRERSDWRIASGAVAFQRELIDGWARASTEIEPEAAVTIEGWRRRRLRHLEEGRSRLTVGHDDLGAWLSPPGSSAGTV
jgi:hypothetical protein